MNKWSSAGGIPACFLLAMACLAAAIYQFQIIFPLETEGLAAQAVVIGSEKGIKGTRKAIYRFTTAIGETITARDNFDMYIVRPHRGEKITVLYDAAQPQNVIADLGLWTWQGPMIFWSGFIFLTSLGIYSQRQRLIENP